MSPLGGLIGGAGEARGAMCLVHDVAIGVVLDPVAERVEPVVVDLAAEQMPPDAAFMLIAARHEKFMAGVERIEILHLELNRRSSSFLAALVHPAFSIASPAALVKYRADAGTVGADGSFRPTGTYATSNPVGTGPFKFESWRIGDKLVFTRNDSYWGTKAKLKKLIFRPITDSTARLQALQSGELDGINALAPQDVPAVASSSSLKVLSRPAFTVGYVGINQKVAPLNNIKVRQAVAYGLDKKAVIGAFYGGRGQVANQFLPPTVEGYAKKGVPDYSYDPAKAKALLQEAGLTLPVTLEFWYPTDRPRPYMPDPPRIFQAFAASLEKSGFKIVPHPAPWRGGYLSGAQSGQAALYLLGWTGDWGDPANFLNVHFAAEKAQFGFNNPSLFKALEAADTETNIDKRTALYQAASIQVMKFLPMVPYANATPALAFKKSVKGYVTSPGRDRVLRSGLHRIAEGNRRTTNMARFVVRRLLLLVPILLGLSILLFVWVRALPGSTAQSLLGERATPAAIARFNHQYGLDRPITTQYWAYLKTTLHGDLGTSVASRRPVTTEIRERFPATIELAFAAMTFALVIGLPLGFFAAKRYGQLFDHSSLFLSLIGVSIPVFFLAIILKYIFSVRLGWLPSIGRQDVLIDAEHPTGFYVLDGIITGNWNAAWDASKHLILPAIALGSIPLAIIARVTRASTLDVQNEDYVRTARAKGLAPGTIDRRHVLRNALLPVTTIIGLQVGILLGGAVLTETVFAIPGMGSWLKEAIFNHDYPALQGGILFLAFVFVIVNLLVDISYGLINPQIRVS